MEQEGQEEVLPPEETPPLLPPALKRALLLLGGVIIIILMLSYVWVSFPVGDILKGKAESHLLAGNVLQAGDITIIFEENALASLQSAYLAEQRHEFALCLRGKKEGLRYELTSFYRPEQQQSFSQVRFAPCDADTLVMLHTHPYRRCAASSTDLATLRRMQQSNPDTLMLVMCDVGRFAVYP